MTQEAVELDYERPVPQVRRARFFLLLAVGLVGFTMSLQTGLNGNFVAQTMGLDGLHQGILEAVRESCGILALLVLALLAGMSEPRIATLMLVLLSIGLSAYAIVPSFSWLMIASFTWSQGLHVWMPLPNSMALAIAQKGHEGKSLGSMGSAGAIGSALALILAIGLATAGVTIRPMWFVAGAAAFLSAIACTFIPKDIKAPGEKLVIRKQYGLFYLLQFLEGWRKQIFIAFAGFLLVQKFNTSLVTMLQLFLVAQVIGWFSAPLTGRMIDRFGERAILLFYYFTMAIVFVCYATLQNPTVLKIMFVADSALFVCTMALTTYIGKLAPKSEHTATMSAGVAANHVASVLMPLVGGLLWNTYGYEWAFFAGAGMAVLTVIPVLWIPSRVRAVQLDADETVS